jgi:2-methylisocitrate lyase-like PEP mutase family enzyme
VNLRSLIESGPLVVAPGAYDGLTARLVADHGFPAVYMTGAGTAAAAGYPDYGLLTLTEMAANAAVVARSAGVPVIADADTGYGNELNVVRTVRAYAAAGVSALHIEDQTFPKRCGHLTGKEVVPAAEWLRKIEAAVRHRPDEDLLVIARTDCRAVAGFDEAVARGRGALEAGADMVFVEAPETVDEVAAVPGLVGGPCLFNVVPGGRSPAVAFGDLEGWGYRVAICPLALLAPVVAASDEALGRLAGAAGVGRADELSEPGSTALGPAELFARLGAADWDVLRRELAGRDDGPG